MERFIKEYANYKIKEYTDNDLMKQEIKDKKIWLINNILRQKEKGLITVDEAIYLIAKDGQ